MTEQNFVDANRPNEGIYGHYIDVDGQCIHYRRTGQGPAVVLLHDSPRSSRLHLGTMKSLSQYYTVFALDTPGYGNSAALPIENPSIADFADALAAALQQLGLQDAPLYATHTSAKIALEYAARHPRHAPIILDGLSIPIGPPNDAFIAAYMRPMNIEPTGGYLAAEWTRMRDMVRWFPWFSPNADTRMAMAMPSDTWLADYAIDFLSAGPHYSSAYKAAMYYDPMPALLRVESPILVAAKRDDVLYSSLDRVPVADNPNLRVERLGTDRDEWLTWLKQSLHSEAAAPHSVQPSCTSRHIIATPSGALQLSRAGAAVDDATPLLLLCAPTILQGLVWQKALPNRVTLLPELPGYGESTPLADVNLDALAEALILALEQSGEARVDILATGLTAALALRMAAIAPQLVRALVIDGSAELPEDLADRIAPTFAFDALSGAHNHQYWHMLRDGEANFPWFTGDIASQRSTEPMLDADAMHQALVGILKQPDHYGDAARILCTAKLFTDAAAITQPCLIFNRPHDAAYAAAAALHNALPHASLVERSITTQGAAEQMSLFFNQFTAVSAEVAA